MGENTKTMTKEFRLNSTQSLIINIDHELYEDILIASLAGQNLPKIIRNALIDSGHYCINFLNEDRWIREVNVSADPSFYIHNNISKIIKNREY